MRVFSIIVENTYGVFWHSATFKKLREREREEKLISPLQRGGRRISSSAFLSRHPFGYYLPIASYGISQVIKQWWA